MCVYSSGRQVVPFFFILPFCQLLAFSLSRLAAEDGAEQKGRHGGRINQRAASRRSTTAVTGTATGADKMVM
ncbi:uncharacterized protein K452DRAFT_291454, partial [Aplosporella prunicola CBS 121167]